MLYHQQINGLFFVCFKVSSVSSSMQDKNSRNILVVKLTFLCFGFFSIVNFRTQNQINFYVHGTPLGFKNK